MVAEVRAPQPTNSMRQPARRHRIVLQADSAWRDLFQGACMAYLWGRLGWADIRQRYRRSKIGPFWLTISMAVMVVSLGVLYAGLFRLKIANYLPFIALGLIVWTLISGVIIEGCMSFVAGEGIIKQVRLPLSIHVYRMVWRNFIIFCHNIVIFGLVAIFFAIWPGWVALLAIPGLAIISFNGVWAGLLLGLVSARFRDVPQIVTSIVQLAFFLTPILWKPELLPNRVIVVDLNPFFHLVELVRAPLMGQLPEISSWLAALVITLLGWIVTFVMYARYRWRIPYWL